MFNIIKSNITPQQARETFLNDYIILLIIDDIKSNTTGDVIFVGSIADRREFVKKIIHRMVTHFICFVEIISENIAQSLRGHHVI